MKKQQYMRPLCSEINLFFGESCFMTTSPGLDNSGSGYNPGNWGEAKEFSFTEPEQPQSAFDDVLIK